MSTILKKLVPAIRRDINLEEPPWRFYVNRLFDSLMPNVSAVSTVGASSLKSPASIWRGVVFVTFLVGMMAIFANNQVQAEYFAGKVTGQDGINIDPATVQINGVSEVTDRSGSFGFDVKSADRYVINVRKHGYALVSQIEDAPNKFLNFTLKQAEVYEIDPSQASEVEDSRGTRIQLDANVLVDSNGNLPTGPVNATVYTYDLANEAIPGDMGGINTDRKDVFMESAGAFWAEFTDASGNKYNLAPDKEATISVPAPKSNYSKAPTLWHYDESTGKWEEKKDKEGKEASAQLIDGRLVGKTDHFSAVNFDWEKREPACVKFEIDKSLFGTFGSPLDVKAVATAPSGSSRTRNFTLSDGGPHVLYNLPENTIVDFYIPPSSSSPYATIDALAAWGGTGIPPSPYDDCNGSIILTPPSACFPPPSDMVGWWPLDENPPAGGVTAAEIAGYSSGAPHNGIYAGEPLPYGGMVDGAVLFNGISSPPPDYVKIPHHADLNFGTGDFSIDAWILNKGGASGVETIVSKLSGSGYRFFLDSGQLGLKLVTTSGSSSSYLTPISLDGNWHHVAVTVDRSNSIGTWYIDGVSTGPTFSPISGNLDNTFPLSIAASAGPLTDFFIGVIDELELFNRVLSPDEVQAIFNAGSGGKCKPDIWIADPAPDDGTEPNTVSANIWNSPDIWVRNNNDGLTQHQNVELGQDNYVYVRARNIGLATAIDTTIEVYRTTASPGAAWDADWVLVGSATIPTLAPSNSQIVSIPWASGDIPNPGHYCFYARTINVSDPLHTVEGTNAVINTFNNNNIAWKNFNVVNLLPNAAVVVHFIARQISRATPTRLVLHVTNENGKAIALPPKVTKVTLGGLENLRINDSVEGFEMQKTREGGFSAEMTGKKASISIDMKKGEEHKLSLEFGATALTPGKASEKYYVHVEQFEGEELVGGITYELVPPKALDIGFTSNNFEKVNVGNNSAAQPFTLSNRGDVPLHIGTIEAVEAITTDAVGNVTTLRSTEFIISDDNCSGKDIPPSAECKFLIEFKAESEGEKKATVFVAYDDKSGIRDTPLTVSLAGIGIKPVFCPDATIETVQSGYWNSPSTWQKLPPGSAIGIPGPNDIVRINNGHTVTAPSTTINVKALCINTNGTLVSNNILGTPLRVYAKTFIDNQGTIRGKKGCNGLMAAQANQNTNIRNKGINDPIQVQPYCWSPRPGADVNLIVGRVCYPWWALDEQPVSSIRSRKQNLNQNIAVPYYYCYYNGKFKNSGTIIAGNGGSGVHGKRGGHVYIRAGDTDFDNNTQSWAPSSCGLHGSVCAGKGGNSYNGGAMGWGGHIHVKAGKKGPLVTPGTISSFSAKDTRFQAFDRALSWYYGGMRFIADSKTFSGVILIAPGAIYIDPTNLSISGANTEINGGDVTLAGGKDATIEFNGINDGAITATGDLTVSVGEGGVIKSDSTNQIMKADGQVNLFADDIILGDGMNVSDMTGDNVVISSGQIMRDVSLTASGDSSGEPGVTLPLDLTLSNNSPEADTYLITVKNEKGWSLNQLPSSIEIEGYGTVEMPLDVVLPSTREATNVITVTAISQSDPTLVTTTEISIVVQAAQESATPSQSTIGGGGSTCPSSGVIKGSCSNRNQVITEATIEEGASVAGGTITATVNNNGIISQVTIGVNAVVNGGKVTGKIDNNGRLGDFEFVGASLTGGELFGNITNNSKVGGVFINVRLAANSSIDGGAVQGEINGDPEGPALLKNLAVKKGSRLTNVIIGENVELGDDVELGEGVRFSDSEQIPNGELIGLLPTLLAGELHGIDYPIRADFSADILVPSEGILSAINALPDLKSNAWVIRQNAELSHFELTLDQIRFAVLPVSVKKATTTAGLEVQDAQTVRFITESGLEVLTHPALQKPNVLLSALSQFGLTEFTVQTNGNLHIYGTEGEWFSARPDWVSVELESEAEIGLRFGQSPLVSGQFLTDLVFSDEEGGLRQQIISPSVAQPDVLYSSAKAVRIESFGLINFKQNGKTYRGVVDYLVTQGETTAKALEVKSIPDANGDGIEDVMLVFPNGEQQRMFVIE